MKNNLFKFLYVTALIVTLLISCKNKTKEPVKTNGENSITVLPNKGNFEQFKDSYIQNLFSKNGQYTLRLKKIEQDLDSLRLKDKKFKLNYKAYEDFIFKEGEVIKIHVTNLDATLYEFYDNQQLESFKEEIKERYIQELTKILNRYL
jgi:hypothetical protein